MPRFHPAFRVVAVVTGRQAAGAGLPRRTIRWGRLFTLALVAGCSSLPAQTPPPDLSALDSLLNTRISSAAKYEQTIHEIAGAVTLVTSEDIERYGYRTLGEVFAAVRGFYVSNDRSYTYLGVRGFSRPTDYNDRILLLIDGHVTNEGVWGSAQFGSELGLDLATLERIEIIRGPGSALYGTGAVFAVVNLVTRTGNAIDGIQLASRLGSYWQRGGSVLFGRQLGSTDVALTGFWDRSDGDDHYYPEFNTPQTSDGIARGHDWERRWGIMSTLRRGDWQVGARLSSRRKAIDTAPYETRFNEPGTGTLDRHGQVDVRYARELGTGKRLTARGYFEGYWYQGDYADSASTNEAALNDVAGSEITFQWDVASANRATVGAEYRRSLRARYYYPRTGPRDYDLNLPYSVWSAYVQDEYQLTSSLAILAGVRWDRYSAEGHATTPRGAVIFTPSPNASVKLLYGRAFRAPSLYERHADGIYTVHNPNLEPERASTVELIYQQRLGAGVLWTVSAFNYRVKGLIDPTPVGSTSMIQFRNVSDAVASGVEVGLDLRLGRRVSGYANYTYQRALDDATRERLTNSPDHLAKAGVGLALAPGVRLAAESRYESSRRTVQDTRTDPFAVVNLNFLLAPRLSSGSALGRGINRLDLAVKLNNLFDASYATPGGLEHRQPAIVQDGRNLLAELRLQF